VELSRRSVARDLSMLNWVVKVVPVCESRATREAVGFNDLFYSVLSVGFSSCYGVNIFAKLSLPPPRTKAFAMMDCYALFIPK